MEDSPQVFTGASAYVCAILLVSCWHRDFWMYKIFGHLITHTIVGLLTLLCVLLILSCFVPLVRYCLRRVLYPHYTLKDFLTLRDSCPGLPICVYSSKFKSEGKTLELLISESGCPVAFRLSFKKLPVSMAYGISPDHELIKWRLRVGK